MCLNNQKIAFVICANDQLYYEDCLWYITQLYVPDGYETDIIGITGAESMVDAYNAAMESSDAKYKVYLHQDVFIYHRGFIEDILRLFQTYEKLGMLGVVGGVNLPKDAVYGVPGTEDVHFPVIIGQRLNWTISRMLISGAIIQKWMP